MSWLNSDDDDYDPQCDPHMDIDGEDQEQRPRDRYYSRFIHPADMKEITCRCGYQFVMSGLWIFIECPQCGRIIRNEE